MAGFTNYLEDKVIGHLFGGSAYTAPGTWYCGLQTASPSDSSAGTEVSGGAYARQSVAWTIVASGVAEANNTAALTWSAATTDWGIIQWAGIYDALTGGNLVAFEVLTKTDFSTANPKTVNTGDIFKIDASNLKIKLD